MPKYTTYRALENRKTLENNTRKAERSLAEAENPGHACERRVVVVVPRERCTVVPRTSEHDSLSICYPTAVVQHHKPGSPTKAITRH